MYVVIPSNRIPRFKAYQRTKHRRRIYEYWLLEERQTVYIRLRLVEVIETLPLGAQLHCYRFQFKQLGKQYRIEHNRHCTELLDVPDPAH